MFRFVARTALIPAGWGVFATVGLVLGLVLVPAAGGPSSELNGSVPSDTPRVAEEGTFIVLNHGRPAGKMTVVRNGDAVTVTYAHIDRNRGRWLQNRYQIDADGQILMAEARPMTRDGEVGEPNDRFELAGGEARWGRGSGNNQGTAPLSPGDFYRLNGVTAFDDAVLARFLLAQPGGMGRLLPGEAEVRVEIAAETAVITPSGPVRARYAVIHGLGTIPRGVWLDRDDTLLASSVAWFITVRPDVATALDQLRAVELAYRNRAAEAAAAELLAEATPRGPVVIRGGDVFDSERGELLPRHTVVVEGDRITALGPAGELPEPTGPDVTIIDAEGRTVIPGLWDMHVHLQATTQSTGALNMLAAGLTTVRDLAADLDVAISYRDRVDQGRLVGPRVLLGGFIEGPGEWAGPSEAIAGNEEEARAWVARYHELGYRQIKLYNLVHPDLVPVIARETRDRGMRLSGHVPRGLSVPAAVRLGFDEINHAAFLFSTFYQDSLYVPAMRPYSGVASTVAPDFDVDAPRVTELIEVLKEHDTVVDGTFAIWMGAGTLEGRGNPASESYARMLKRLYDAGVTIVAGTDNTQGATFVTELQLHEYAGIPTPEVLQLATIGAARVMGEDADYGSIAPGKVADILVVDGRPLEDGLGALRSLTHVIRGGRVFTPEALRQAVGGGYGG